MVLAPAGGQAQHSKHAHQSRQQPSKLPHHLPGRAGGKGDTIQSQYIVDPQHIEIDPVGTELLSMPTDLVLYRLNHTHPELLSMPTDLVLYRLNHTHPVGTELLSMPTDLGLKSHFPTCTHPM